MKTESLELKGFTKLTRKEAGQVAGGFSLMAFVGRLSVSAVMHYAVNQVWGQIECGKGNFTTIPGMAWMGPICYVR